MCLVYLCNFYLTHRSSLNWRKKYWVFTGILYTILLYVWACKHVLKTYSYVIQWYITSRSPHATTKYESDYVCFNTLRPRQNGRHFADAIFKYIFLNKDIWISIQISLQFVRKGPISNIRALVQIMACRRPGDEPLSELMLANLLTHICLNELSVGFLWHIHRISPNSIAKGLSIQNDTYSFLLRMDV